MSQLLLNPRKRRARKSRKARSPAQRAATRKMLAANRSRRSPRRSRRSVVHANPIRRSRRRSYRRNPISARSRRAFSRVRSSGAFSLLKSGAMFGAGAVAGDILFGQLSRFLPPSMAVPVDASGATNWLYFATKAAMLVAVGTLAKKVIPGRYADAIAVGGIAVMGWQIFRSMVPSSLTMGAYVNPGAVMNPRGLSGVRGMARVGGVAAYQALPSAAMGGPASQVMAAQGMRR